MKTNFRQLVVLGFFLTVLNLSTFAQISINTDGTQPDSSAGLDVKFNNKGFLPPRMTTTEILAIISPPAGLIAYNSTLNTLVFYNGTTWVRTDGQFSIGQSYGGGIIFYLDGTGAHGLIAATADESYLPIWGCTGMSIATNTVIGNGQENTSAIVAGCGMTGIAAKICNDLVLNGYTDWFLPSKDELYQMYLQRTAIGGFFPVEYWSSSEVDVESGWSRAFYNGSSLITFKSRSL